MNIEELQKSLLVHYGFTREEVLWMSIPEVEDYIQLINKDIEDENKAASGSTSSEPKEAPTLSDVYRGPIG